MPDVDAGLCENEYALRFVKKKKKDNLFMDNLTAGIFFFLNKNDIKYCSVALRDGEQLKRF